MMYKWEELTGRDFEKLEFDLAILPVGTVERHGDHLPLGTDVIVPVWLAEKVAERFNGAAVVLPPVTYGVTVTLAKFKGSINIPSWVFMAYVKHLIKEVARNGIGRVLIINGHGGNTRELQLVAKEVASQTETAILIVDWWRDVAQDVRMRLFKFPGHAGSDETSAVLAIRPELVKMEYAKDHIAPYPALKIYSRKLDEELFPEAVNGKATEAGVEKGKEYMEAVIQGILTAVNTLMKY